MALHVNEVFPGLETDEREGLLDISAFLVGNDVYIEVLKVRLSLAVAKSKFIGVMIDREMQKLPRELRTSPSRREAVKSRFSPKREFVEENGAYVIKESGGAVGAWLYLVFDSNMGRMNLSPDSTPSLDIDENTPSGTRNTILLRSVSEWVSNYFEVPDENLEFVSGPVPFTDYQIHTLSEYPIIYQMAADLKMSIRLFDQMNVLLVKYHKSRARDAEESEIFRRLKESVPGFDGTKDVFLVGDFAGGHTLASERFVYEHDGKPVFALDAPFYIINEEGKRPIEVAELLLGDIISSRSSEGISSPESRLRDKMRLAYYTGRDLGNMTYQLLLQKSFVNFSSSERERILQALGTEEDAENKESIDLLCFMDMMLQIYSNITSSKIGNPFDKRYYTTTHAAEIKYPEMFGALCEIVEEKNGMYLIRSSFNMPPEIFAMFGIPKVSDMYTLDPASSTLTSNLSYQIDRTRRNWTAPLGSTPNTLTRSMYEDAQNMVPEVEDRHREAIMVHGLSSIPACNVPAQGMFNRRGVEFRDIMIILVQNPQNRGMLGGFASARENPNPVSMFKNVAPFKPPFIMLNILAPGMATVEDRVSIILHEVSHFVDDILVSEGRADPRIMKIPASPQTPEVAEQMRYWQDYLDKTPTEVAAHAEEVYFHLSMYDYDYALRNKAAIRKKVVEEILGPVSEREPVSVTVERMRLYNAIFERGWEAYEQDHTTDVDEVPALEPDALEDDKD